MGCGDVNQIGPIVTGQMPVNVATPVASLGWKLLLAGEIRTGPCTARLVCTA